MKYRNKRTGTILDTFGEISGEDYEEVKEGLDSETEDEIDEEEDDAEVPASGTEEPVKKKRGRKPAVKEE